MSLVAELGVELRDLLPIGPAHAVLIGASPLPYQISSRLYQALRVKAQADGVSVEVLASRLRDEVNAG